MRFTGAILALALAATWGCKSGDPGFDVGDTDTGTDTGTDGDSDADTDADTDTGEDEEPPELPSACTADTMATALSGPGDGRSPTVAVTGGSGLLAWAYDEQAAQADWDVQVATFEPGIPPSIGAPVEPVTGATVSERPSLAVRGGAFGLAWLDTRWDTGCDAANQDACQRDVAFVELGADGQPAGGSPPLRVTDGEDPGGWPVLAATESGWLIAWAEDLGSVSAEIRIVAIDDDGQPGSVHVVAAQGSAAPDQRPGLAAIGDQALIAWLAGDQNAILLRRIAADGSPQGEPLPAVQGSLCGRPGLAAGDGELLLTYPRSQGADLEIRALRIDATGTALGGEQRLTWTISDTTRARPAWNGSEWAVVWLSEYANGAGECAVTSCQPQVFFTALDATAKPRAEEVLISGDQNYATDIDLAWDGTGWISVFELLRNQRKQVHWAHAFCD